MLAVTFIKTIITISLQFIAFSWRSSCFYQFSLFLWDDLLYLFSHFWCNGCLFFWTGNGRWSGVWHGAFSRSKFHTWVGGLSCCWQDHYRISSFRTLHISFYRCDYFLFMNRFERRLYRIFSLLIDRNGLFLTTWTRQDNWLKFSLNRFSCSWWH